MTTHTINSETARTEAQWQESGREPMSRKQQKLLNAACGDLALCIPKWDGVLFNRDDYRHLIAAVVLGERIVRGINTGEGNPGLIRMSRSSLEFTKSEATAAVRMAFDIGDNPEDQGLPNRPVRWCAVVCLARYIVDDIAA
jgi:hypothetical protein